MPKPSLRERWQYICEHDKSISQSALALLRALVEAVEPEDTELAKTKVEIERLRTRVANAVSGAGVVIEKLRSELAEARADWARLATEHHEAKIIAVNLRSELAKAKVEIERLRKERNDYRADLAEELRRRECLILAKVASSDAEEAMRADAEIGRLVRRMDKNTLLLRLPSGRFHALCSSPDSKDFWNWGRAAGAICVADPALALRAIQEVGDAERM